MQKYHIRMNLDEIALVQRFLQSEAWNCQSRTRANVLLDLNEEKGKRLFSVEDIARRNGVSKVMVWHVCKKYQHGGVHAVLHRQNAKSMVDVTLLNTAK